MRKINAENPVINVFSNDYTCGEGAVPINDNGVARVANVAAGSNITYQWATWPHLSPIQTWMAKCDPDCGSFTGSVGKVWFKIEEDGANPQWATQKLHNNAFRWNVTVPACIAPGQYLVRHEIVQTDSCKTKGDCHQFINCIQVNVLGSGTTVPPSTAKIAIPGDIKFEDPGIWWDVYKQNKTTYLGPGPRAWKCPT